MCVCVCVCVCVRACMLPVLLSYQLMCTAIDKHYHWCNWQVLTAAQCRCYANERDVLTLPLMRHPGVVEFIGCREDWVTGGVGTQLMIVMSYERLGCLVDYLKNSTVDWSTACRMMHSLAAGLAHMHTELTNGGVCFYCVMVCIRGTSHGPVSVRVCFCLSQVGVLLKRLNVGSHKQHHTIAQGL